MTAIIPSNHFTERVEALIEDWKGQDEMFYHDSALRTIIWYVGKARSLQTASAEIRTGDRTRFMAAVAQGYGMDVRRLQEAVAVYKQYAKSGDSVMETSERIFQKVGRWSKALPAKKEEAQAAPKCRHCFHCPDAASTPSQLGD